MRSSSSARRSTRAARTAAAALAAVLLTGACRVDVKVGVDADAAGGGSVSATATLDRAAVTAVGDLRTKLDLKDLTDAGWRVSGPTTHKDGTATVTARHGFTNAAQAEHLLADLGGPFQGFRLRQHHSFIRTETTLTGRVDLRPGLGAFSDPALDEALRAAPGQTLGVPDADLEQRLGTSLDRLFGLQVVARLPGHTDARATNAPIVTGNGAAWSPKLGEQVQLTAVARRWNVANLVEAGIALLAAAALLAVAAERLIRRRRDPVVTVSNDGEDAPVG